MRIDITLFKKLNYYFHENTESEKVLRFGCLILGKIAAVK